MKEKYEKALVLFGVVMVNIPYSVGMYYGNLLSYVYSYRYSVLGSDSGDLDPTWLLGLCLAFFTLGNLVEALIQRIVGLRLATLVGIFLFVSGLMLCYFSIQHSIWATLLPFAVLVGVGNGMLQAASMFYIAEWFRQKVGIVSAAAGSSAGIGGIIMNLLLTSYTNPDNLSTDELRGKITFFSQSSIVDRIPSAFVVIGGVTAAFQIIGIVFLRSPSHERFEKENTEYEVEASERFDLNETTRITRRTDLTGPVEKRSTVSHRNPEEDGDVKPMDVLKLERYYVVFFSGFAIALGQLIVTSYYKVFGQLWISDDTYLAGLGSSLSISAIFARFLCGYVADKFGSKKTIIMHLGITSVLQSTWYFSPMLSPWCFFIWTNLVFAFLNCQYVLFPIVTIQMFGKKYCATNLFLVNLALMLAMFISPPLMNFILNSFGWFWLFSFSGFLSMCSLVITVIRL